MRPSPYHPGALPAYLAGRGRELELVRERLARLAEFGRSGGPLLAFHGPRGLGKTSLLREAQREAIDAGYLTAWLTGRNDESLAPALARALASEVRRLSFGERARGLLHSLDKIQVEVGIPGAKIGVETGGGRESAAIEASLEDAGKFARNHDHRGLVLFVDEFQDARLADRRSVLIALQHADGDPAGCPVAVIAAGLPQVMAAVPDAATFGERTEFVEVGLLRDVAVAEALRVPALEHGVTWTDAAVLEAIEVAQGYPHLVQLLGAATWDVARPEEGSAIEAAHVRAGAEAAVQRMETLFAARLSKINADQFRFVEAMATFGEGLAQRAAIADVLGVESRSLSRVRQELIDKGLIEPAGRGAVRFTLPGFASYVLDRAGDR